MSVFVVQNSTINIIVSHLNSLMPHSEARRHIERLGYDLDSLCSLERLGDAMLELNVDSVLQRYRDISDVPDEAFELEFVRCANPMQPLKSLACFLYQSCEGDCDLDPLFKALQAVEDIMRQSKNGTLYEQAEWD